MDSIFTPEFGTKDKQELVKTGTTTVGIICKDCVVMAADKRATAGHLIANKKTEKVRPVTDHIVVTTAGGVADLQLLYKYLHAELKLKLIRGGRHATVKEAANLLSSWVYNIVRRSYSVVHFLVGGYDTKPQLFDVYPDGSTMDVDDYLASGSGSVFALGVLENKYKNGLSKEEGVQLALEAINAALARDSASGNGVDVFVTDAKGTEQAVSKEILTTV
ncbi:MAG: proteasome subunit beta [Candidatus Woesearchaeota archaeon]|nr:proteasome subunit beta [Candidatus Woesearchaeota archaeon]